VTGVAAEAVAATGEAAAETAAEDAGAAAEAKAGAARAPSSKAGIQCNWRCLNGLAVADDAVGRQRRFQTR